MTLSNVKVKEEGRAVHVHRVLQCLRLRFAKGSCREFRETGMSDE